MQKMLVICLLLPLFGLRQAITVLSSNRVFPKPEKIAEFEKALANHAQKYHTGDLKWRVWAIESGPDFGGYMNTAGPNSWEQHDGRGEISAEHTADWNNNVAPLTEDRASAGYYEFVADLSTVALTDYSDKIVINHMESKPGRISNFTDMIKKLKKAWEAGTESVAVYRVVASGDPGYITVTRLRQGLKELAEGYRKPLAERFNTANGAGSFDAYLKDYADNVQKRWSELLVYRPALSSKP